MRLKSTIYESTLSTAGTVPLPQWGRQRGGGFAAEKGSQPRLAALGSPFQWKGLAWSFPPFYGRRCPEGAEVGWGSGMKDKWERLSQVRRLREHPIHRWRGPPSLHGEGYDTRIPLFSHCQNKYTHMWKNNTDGQSLPRVGKVANGASRIGF